MPAEPQQISPSAISRTSRPGMARSALRGWARMPWAWPRWQASCQATRIGSGCRGATGPSSTSSSDRSRTRRRERLGPLGVRRVVAEQVAVLLHGRAAAGRVDHHLVDPGGVEGLDGRPGERLGLGLAAGVQAEGAAAALGGRGDDLAAVGGQDPGGGRVDLGEEHPLDAAGEHPDPPPARPGGRGDLGDLLQAAQGGQEPLHGRQPPSQPVQQPGPPGQDAEPRALVEAERAPQDPQPPRVGEQPEDQGPEGAVAPGARVAALDLLAGGLDQLAVLDPGRAGGDTGHAAQALVEVADHLVVQGLALAPDLHQVDPPPGRVHLLAPEHVGRAGGQAEAAVDAVVDQLLLGRVVVVEGGQHAGPGLGVVGHLRSLPRTGPGSSGARGRSAP